jgi:hypothetical protein
MKINTEEVSLNELCELWFCCPESIKGYIKKGMPHKKEKGRYIFNLADCQAWYRGDTA